MTAAPQGGNGAQPPVTVTGVAPWAFKKDTSGRGGFVFVLFLVHVSFTSALEEPIEHIEPGAQDSWKQVACECSIRHKPLVRQFNNICVADVCWVLGIDGYWIPTVAL